MRTLGALTLFLALPLVAAADTDFKEFKSTAGKFKVQMPGTPKEITQNAPFGKMTMYMLQEGTGGYAAAYMDLPIPANEKEDMIQTRLDGAVNGAAGNVKGKVLSQSKIKLDNKYPGREMVIEGANGQIMVKGRIFLVGTRMYMLMSLGNKDFINSDSSKKFLVSFALIK